MEEQFATTRKESHSNPNVLQTLWPFWNTVLVVLGKHLKTENLFHRHWTIVYQLPEQNSDEYRPIEATKKAAIEHSVVLGASGE